MSIASINLGSTHLPTSFPIALKFRRSSLYKPSISCVIAQVTYDPSKSTNTDRSIFAILANYIGAFGSAQNAKPEKIAMTAPVITKTTTSEQISMTAPVITSKEGSSNEEMMMTMGFILPEKYQKCEDAPRPVDERVVIREEGERKYGVVTFSGVAREDVVAEKVAKLKNGLERDGFKVVGDYVLGRYNPPWLTLPMFRTNEVKIPVD